MTAPDSTCPPISRRQCHRAPETTAISGRHCMQVFGVLRSWLAFHFISRMGHLGCRRSYPAPPSVVEEHACLFVRRILESLFLVCRRVLFAVQHDILPFQRLQALDVGGVLNLDLAGAGIDRADGPDLDPAIPNAVVFALEVQDGLAILGSITMNWAAQFGQTGPLHSSSSTK